VKINLSKRPFLAAAVLGAVAVFALAFLVALTVRSVVAGPAAVRVGADFRFFAAGIAVPSAHEMRPFYLDPAYL